MKFSGDIIITDPCYIICDSNDEDWGKTGYGEDMSILLDTNNYLSKETGVGDWSNEIYDKYGQTIGKFCADSGMVGVFNLQDVLKYNPDFNYHIEKTWTTSLIKDFDGDIDIIYNDGVAEVIGNGNIKFSTISEEDNG